MCIRDRNSTGNLRISEISGPVGSEVITLGTAYPYAISSAFSGPGAPQAGTGTLIDDNDIRMQNVVYRNGYLWATYQVFLPATAPTRSSVQWCQVSPTGAVVQLGTIDDPTSTIFYSMPSIAVNKFNDVLIGYSQFSPTTYASAAYSYRNSGDAPNTMQNGYIFKSGLGIYIKTYGSGRNRWGDFSATMVDPTNDTDMWTIQEYADTPTPPGTNDGDGEWATWWAGLIIIPTIDDINPTSPAIGVDGTIYVGSSNNNLYAINPTTGETEWTFTTGGVVNSSPAIGADGTIYVGSDDDKLYAINPTGGLKWSYTTGAPVVSSPAIDTNGIIYVGSQDNDIYAINPDGTLRWKYATGGPIDSSPCIGADGTIYVGGGDGNFYAIH